MKRICIIGGCGHVGIPLGLAFACRALMVTLIDRNQTAVNQISNGCLPFKEEHAEELLRQHIGKNLFATTDASQAENQDVVVFVTGTPVDHLISSLPKQRTSHYP